VTVPASGRSARQIAQRAVDLIALFHRPADAAQVAQVLRAHGERDPALTAADVRDLREAAGRIAGVFTSRDVDGAAEVLNALLAAYAHPPRLTTHGGKHPWHLHVDGDDDGPWGEWLASSSALALATLLAERQAVPGGVCAARSCRAVFLDTGSGSPRRYCSTRCATRERVAAHRARTASADRPSR
jgi:predicted RNA-binding Zn ribbon-like protein